ncbi:MAG: AMP-binding protein [Proteobacteria bacterium]|nr:acyl-CoA synthetase [Desulfocapsa sp.]MBU4030529.1 AMP-binding protein [Pseudomonadota bacterium]MBU4044699.1 AMP-binding protein [Pseudomonadota bacterium]
MELRKGKVVAICCCSESAFVRAHLWAIGQGRISLLVPQTEWRQLSVLATMFDKFTVLTDDPSNQILLPFELEDAEIFTEKILPPSTLWPDPLAILLTSGTTGTPKPVVKSVIAMLGEIESLRKVMNIDTDSCFVSTVPFEHMFGYSFGFWLPHLAQVRLDPKRVFLPIELKTLCNNSTTPLWIVTTPVHLRAYVELKIKFKNIAGVVCATSPLSSALARQAAYCFGVPITEIYGSTETGAIAFRKRHADEDQEPWWSPLPGMTIQLDEGGVAQCQSSHLDGVIPLGDRIELDVTGFRILGRTGDIVKVYGKRQSRTALNNMISSVPGVVDASYFFHNDGECNQETSRPIAFVVLERGATIPEVLAHIRGRVDDVFLPRPIFVVKSLPRSETGKLGDIDLRNLYRMCKARNATT